MSIVKGKFTSEWDGGIKVTTNCDINLDTKEVTNIEAVDPGTVNDLDREYITYTENGKEITAPVMQIDALDCLHGDEGMPDDEYNKYFWYD